MTISRGSDHIRLEYICIYTYFKEDDNIKNIAELQLWLHEDIQYISNWVKCAINQRCTTSMLCCENVIKAFMCLSDACRNYKHRPSTSTH